ncbi:MAG: hypothetical protein ACJ8F7_12335, partial [Gemmataceae bacterium]
RRSQNLVAPCERDAASGEDGDDMDYRDQVADLLDRAQDLGHGAAQAALTEQAVELADEHHDEGAGFFARQEHVNATMFAGQPDKMLVAFSWLLAQIDRHPDRYDLQRVLWQYKWVVDTLPDFPQITRAQIEEMFADMERRYEAHGASLQVVYLKRRAVAMAMGDHDAAVEADDAMQRFRRDDLSDCKACEMDSACDYYYFLGADEVGVEKASPLLRGRYTCSEVPQLTLASILLPLLRLGRGEQAMPHHVLGYRMISKNPVEFIPSIASHIEFLALTGNLARALKLVERHLGLALATPCLAWQFDVFLAVKLLLEELRAAKRGTLKVRLPDTFPMQQDEYDTAELLGWFDSRLADAAKRFDARNGNDFFRQRLPGVARQRGYRQPVSLPRRDDGEAPSKWERS